ncbi:MAG: sugar phosphate isomerase/epimerase family protein [Gemmataceae bacterium]
MEGAVYVACSTLCFLRHPLDRALRIISELDFSKVDVAIHESGPHLKPSEVAKDVAAAVQRVRIGPSLTPGAYDVEIETDDQEVFAKQLQAICRMARLTTVSTITLTPGPNSRSIGEEAERLKPLVTLATAEGINLTLATLMGTLTETPKKAIALCQAVPGLGLTLDPSHYLVGPHQGHPFENVLPFVKHVHFRDTGRSPDQFQVRVGQGQIEYGRIISQLNRVGYQRVLSVDIRDIPDAPFVMESEVRKLKFLLESLI